MKKPIDNWNRFDDDSDVINEEFALDEDSVDVDLVDYDKMTDTELY